MKVIAIAAVCFMTISPAMAAGKKQAVPASCKKSWDECVKSGMSHGYSSSEAGTYCTKTNNGCNP